MNSCDTFALGKSRFALGKDLLCKNSDRPLGEAQPLRFFNAADHGEGETLKCTHLTIPQVSHTYALIGAQPYWIWGFETGANEKGVFIGNEAQGSRCDAEKVEGLLGMDLLRLGLERGATAREALEVITKLLEEYGQNANANMLFDRRYENSFMIVDPDEIWLLETAGRQWAAKKIDGWRAISNCYTIGEDCDLISEGAESYARERRYMAPGQKLDFARDYTLNAARQTASVPRKRRLDVRISAYDEALSLADCASVMRDHFEGEINEPRYGACLGTFVSICMHAMTWDGTQTASSLQAYSDDVLGPVLRYAPSIPCCSAFIPVYWTGNIPEVMSRGGEFYDDSSLWWLTERLAMAVSIDEERFGDMARRPLRELEARLSAEAAEAEKRAKELLLKGDRKSAFGILDAVTEKGAEEMCVLCRELAEKICGTVAADGGLYGPRKDFLEAYAGRTRMPL